MVVIRLSRGGAKKAPFYNIVAADKRAGRDGRYIERLGYFNPVARGAETRLSLNVERFDHWVSQGAQPSDRVKDLEKKFKQGDERVLKSQETRKNAKIAQQKAAASQSKAVPEADKATESEAVEAE
jgi:small subunit ribosomal protein S16